MSFVLSSINTSTWFGKLRYFCVKLISLPDFELAVILLIFANCVSLSMVKPQQGPEAPWNKTLNTVELVLNACFSFELIVRIIASGGILVCHKL